MIRISLLAAFLCVLLTHATKAATDPSNTVQELYMQCKSSDTVDVVACISYVDGVFDMLQVSGVFYSEASATREARTALYPIATCGTKVTGGQMAQIFINWAEANPKEWQQPKIIGVWAAVQRAWPCTNSAR